VTFVREGDVIVERDSGPGGVETLLRAVTRKTGAQWLFCAMTDADRLIARAFPRKLPGDGLPLQMLEVPMAVQHGHYDVVGGLLSKVFHLGLGKPQDIPRRSSLLQAWASYIAVNAAFASISAQNLNAATLIQDHHLMLVGSLIRRRWPQFSQPLSYFHHVPWCEPDDFGSLPGSLSTDLLAGALAYDTVSFHTRRWANAFVRCCDRLLPEVACDDDAVTWRGRTVQVRVAPGTIDIDEVSRSADSLSVYAAVDRIRRQRRGRMTCVRVDRWVPAKNALGGFLAFEELLRRHGDLASHVWFLAVLTKPHRASRETLQYHEACRTVVRRVNDRFRANSRAADVITLVVNDADRTNNEQALAAMKLADVVLVNPVRDGMNLVAKETCIASASDAVLVLSRDAGVAEELGNAALLVNPLGMAETAGVLERALTMPAVERRTRARALREVVSAGRISSWFETQVETGAHSPWRGARSSTTGQC
jgi:trehalose 6-phosphate synthase